MRIIRLSLRPPLLSGHYRSRSSAGTSISSFKWFENTWAGRLPVRQDAKPADLYPKNMDLYIDDLQAQLEPLKAAGLKFRHPDYTEMVTPEGEKVRDIHLHGHDQTNRDLSITAYLWIFANASIDFIREIFLSL